MRSFDPNDEDDVKALGDLNAEPWMIEHLKLNPEYPHWGPGEDSMMVAQEDESSNWDSSLELASWSAFGPWELDTHNECVHFYFELDREATACGCELGYSPQALQFHHEWYGKASPPFDPIAYGATPLSLAQVQEFARRNVERHPAFYGTDKAAVLREARRLHAMWSVQWMHHLNQADVDALAAEGRLWAFKEGTAPTAEAVNAAYLGGFGHDAINESVCLKARCARAGVPVLCLVCGGSASIYTAPAAHLNLVVWMLHPRKGCSRGVRIQKLSRQDAAAARTWLRAAAQRNAERFAKVVAL